MFCKHTIRKILTIPLGLNPLTPSPSGYANSSQVQEIYNSSQPYWRQCVLVVLHENKASLWLRYHSTSPVASKHNLRLCSPPNWTTNAVTRAEFAQILSSNPYFDLIHLTQIRLLSSQSRSYSSYSLVRIYKVPVSYHNYFVLMTLKALLSPKWTKFVIVSSWSAAASVGSNRLLCVKSKGVRILSYCFH